MTEETSYPGTEIGLTYSDRGFKQFPEIESVYGGNIRAYESSSAEHPRIWIRAQSPVNLNEPEGEMLEAVAHLDVEDADRLWKQIKFLVENHYHFDDEKPKSELRASVYKDAAGEWRWHLQAKNNRIVAHSGEGYENKADALSALHLVCPGAEEEFTDFDPVAALANLDAAEGKES